jgi:hypothetical protein
MQKNVDGKCGGLEGLVNWMHSIGDNNKEKAVKWHVCGKYFPFLISFNPTSLCILNKLEFYNSVVDDGRDPFLSSTHFFELNLFLFVSYSSWTIYCRSPTGDWILAYILMWVDLAWCRYPTSFFYTASRSESPYIMYLKNNKIVISVL